ncbi:MAG TPA: MoaD/ThiS family protein [Acidimicrobiales bacterium]|nr:MoaD/ThiS family protein [Acidimicrobiales bacterium]
MPVLRLFAAAREAAGVARAELEGTTVEAILQQAELRYGERFSGVLARSRVWVNGQPADTDTAVQGHDVIAVLPPVSGGSDSDQLWGAKVAAADPLVEEAPVALDLMEREPEVADEGPPTGVYETVWLDEVNDLGLEEPELDEPRWLAAEPEANTDLDSPSAVELSPHPEDVEVATERPAPEEPAPEEPWSGWSSASGSFQAVVQPGADSAHRGLQPFAPAAPEPRPPRPPLLPPESPALPVDPSATEDAAKAPTPIFEGGLRKVLSRLAVVHDSRGPHGRLGLLWAIVTVGAAAGGAEFLAAWLGLTAFVGACQASRVRLGQGRLVLIGTSAVIAVAIPGVAILGYEIVAATVGGAVVLAFVAALFFSRGSATRDGTVIAAVGVSLGLAAAAPVLLRADHIEAAFLLLAYAATYDAGAYLVGTGASSVWEGPVAGVAALIPVVILSAVLLVPPFQPGTPVLLGLLAAILAPLGPLVGSAVVGDGEAHAPGLRRLDSLIVLGPIWAAAAVAFID